MQAKYPHITSCDAACEIPIQIVFSRAKIAECSRVIYQNTPWDIHSLRTVVVVSSGIFVAVNVRKKLGRSSYDLADARKLSM